MQRFSIFELVPLASLYYMKPYFSCSFIVCGLPIILLLAMQSPQATAQEEFRTYVDLHVNSLTRPFYAQDSIDGIKYNIWEQINNECAPERSAEIMNAIGTNVPKVSQSNFEEMLRGNVRLFCLTLSPIEQQYILNNTYLNDKNKRATLACIYGWYGSELLLRSKEIDYFQVLTQQIHYLQQHEGKPYYINGKAHSYKIVRTKSDIDSVLNNPQLLGIILCVEGTHSLGHSVYISNIDLATSASSQASEIEKEYQEVLQNNVARLKGLEPLAYTPNSFLNAPVFYMTLAKTFPNGLYGASLAFNRAQLTYISRPNDLGLPASKLGKKVVELLVSSGGERKPIYVDIQHLSLEARKNFYAQNDRASLVGGEIPIIASHTGISGLDWESPLYKKKDDENKNNNEYLNHWQQNLGKQDIEKIAEYKGLIGITLDKTVLGGALSLRRLSDALPHTTRKRSACLELFLANVFKIVQTLNKKQAWDIIAVGSNFDAMTEPLDAYPSARHLRNLHSDIQAFLDNPYPIAPDATGLTVSEINRLKFGYTGIEIADKILWKNSILFFRQHLNEKPLR